MTDFNITVPQSRNKTLSFWAFEKERWHNIYLKVRGFAVQSSKKEINPIVLAYKTYKGFHKPAKTVAHKMVACGLISAVFEGLEPFFYMLVLGSLPALLGNSEAAVLVFLSYWGLYCLREILDPLFNDLRYFFTHYLQGLYVAQECCEKYVDIIKKPRPFFVTNTSATLSDMVTQIALDKVALFFDVLDMARGIIVLIVTGTSLFYVSSQLFFAMALLGLLYMEICIYSKYLLRQSQNKCRLMKAKVRQINRDVMSCSALVQEALKTGVEQKLINKRNNRLVSSRNKVSFLEFKLGEGSRVVLLSLIAIVVALVAVIDIIQTRDIGRFVLISGAAFKFRQRCYQLVTWYGYLLFNRNQVVDTEKQLITPKALERKSGEKRFNAKDNKITFANVKFAYPKLKDVTKIENDNISIERGEEVLHGINAEINKGGITVIAGTSGQGKSTLMSLIRHDYDVTDGKILIGNTNVQNVTDEMINAQIAFVDQNVHFFDNTLLYNLKYFNPSATDEQVKEALDAAGLSEDIALFKDGVFYRIGQDGRALSGGQRQRLALARIFLTDRPIVIMDEPTTGLDQVLSFKVMKALRKLSQTKTVLLVTHNPTEIALADRILVIKAGQIVADGTPLELIETSDFLSSAMTKQDIISKQQLFRNC